MALNPPPIQEITADKRTGRFPQVWIRWLTYIFNIIEDLNSGGVTSINGLTGVVVLSLDDLDDVNASSPSNGNVIVYNSISGVWELGATDALRLKSRDTTTATIDDSAYSWFGNTDSAGFTYTLPAGVDNRSYRIVNTGTSSNVLTIAPDGAENLIGVNSVFTLNDGDALIITYDTTDGWY